MEKVMEPIRTQPSLKTILAAELFSKLTEQEQDEIISQLKALLSHEE
ncbi:MAG: hypothetical protein IKB82_08155 [Clostridia bacterium]|nr:hypothetical protein [Clostridia bacterium]MBR6653237.1 hypothetical protein [Oscillospiraceae bacterium]